MAPRRSRTARGVPPLPEGTEGDKRDRRQTPRSKWPVDEWLSPELFDGAWARLLELDLPLVDKVTAWQRLNELRRPYRADLEHK